MKKLGLCVLLVPATCGLVWLPKEAQAQNAVTRDTRDKPFLRLDGKSYDLKSLTSFSEAELDQLLATEANALSDAELIQSPVDAQTLQKGEATRARREKIYRASARESILFSLSNTLVRAAIFDNIVKTHGLAPEKYFDFDAAIEYEKRYQKYIDFFYSKKMGNVAQEKAMFEVAVKDYQFILSFSVWQSLRQLSGTKTVSKIISGFNANNPDILAKSHMAFFLVKDAIENGVYQKQGREFYQFNMSSVYLVEITDFEGDLSTIQKLAQGVTDENGVFSNSAYAKLQAVLRRAPSRAKVSFRQVFGAGVREQFGLPKMGRVYQTAPDKYQFFAWANKPQDQTQPEAQEAMALFYKAYATEAAAKDYMPSIEWLTMGAVAPSLLTGSIGTAGFGVELKQPTITRAPYPAIEFSEFPELQKEIDRFVFLYAIEKSKENKEEMERLIQEFKENTKNIETATGTHMVSQTLATLSDAKF